MFQSTEYSEPHFPNHAKSNCKNNLVYVYICHRILILYQRYVNESGLNEYYVSLKDTIYVYLIFVAGVNITFT